MPQQPSAAFCSYARDDYQFALRFVTDLKRQGGLVWLDQLDIKPGDRWDRAIESALAGCSQILIVLSPSSVASQNVMDEVSYALEEGKTVIPILYRDCVIPFRLRRVQYIDFRTDYDLGVRGVLALLSTQEKPANGTAQIQIETSVAPVASPGEPETIAGTSVVEPAKPRHQPFTYSRRIYLIGASGAVFTLATTGAWYLVPHEPPAGSYRTKPLTYSVYRGQWRYEQIRGMFATAAFYRAVKPRLVIGRLFSEEELSLNPKYAPNRALLDNEFWKRKFGSDQSILTSGGISLNDYGFGVVGVVSMRGWQDTADVWLPSRADLTPF